MSKKIFEEVEIPQGASYPVPEPTPIFRPFAGVEEFWPCENPDEHDWLHNYEQQHLVAIGRRIAALFGVPLINDTGYNSATEEERATSLFCVVTRGEKGPPQTKPGIFTWNAICVVARYCNMVTVRCQLDASNNRFWILDAKTWFDAKKQYEIIFDKEKMCVQDLDSFIQILDWYARMEGLSLTE